jgi:hypothetical protein
MNKVLTTFAILFFTLNVKAQEVGIGGEYLITDNKFNKGYGIEVFYEHDYTDWFSVRYLHNITLLRYQEETVIETGNIRITESNSSQLAFYGLGAIANFTLLRTDKNFEVMVGAGPVFHGTFVISVFSDSENTILGRTELRSSLTIKYSQIGNSIVGLYACVNPGLILRSDSHYGQGREIGKQIGLLSFQAGFTFDLSKD